MNNLFEQLEELKGVLQSNVNTDWSENDPSAEFKTIAENLQTILDNNPTRDCREFLKSQGYFVENLWCSQDIIETGANNEIEISEEQALEIMELMGRRFDANVGIDWEVIEIRIDEYFNEQ